jgi:mono/diheme cytochrome c family protein
VLPGALFAVVATATFTLAELHLAKAETPRSSGPIALGDPQHGQLLFGDTCAACHGQGGKGGGIGPKLAGASITLAAAKAQIDKGGGTMPAGLVKGGDEEDVLAYLKTILAGQ